ncbi:YfbU family protein [Lactococcus lactis]|nr:YfbU family protein [Lactococcus lactis]
MIELICDKKLLGDMMVYSEEVKKEVEDILEMYTDLFYTWDNNEDVQEKVQRKQVIFRGFDGNLKAEYYGYAADLVNEKEQFPVIAKMIKEIDKAELNSKSYGPSLFKLKMMVKKWKEIKSKEDFVSLKASDILEIVQE